MLLCPSNYPHVSQLQAYAYDYSQLSQRLPGFHCYRKKSYLQIKFYLFQSLTVLMALSKAYVNILFQKKNVVAMMCASENLEFTYDLIRI